MPYRRCVFSLLACLLLVGRGSTGPRHADEQRLQQAGVRGDGPSLLEFFRKRSTRLGREEVRDLIRQLGAQSFAVRARASMALVECGARAVPQLLQVSPHPDVEVHRRAVACLRKIDEKTPPSLV